MINKGFDYVTDSGRFLLFHVSSWIAEYLRVTYAMQPATGRYQYTLTPEQFDSLPRVIA